MKFFDFKEDKQHGRFDFPIEFYHVDQSHPRYDMPYHWHTQCEIIRILKGEFLITIDYKKILAKKGDILFKQEYYMVELLITVFTSVLFLI